MIGTSSWSLLHLLLAYTDVLRVVTPTTTVTTTNYNNAGDWSVTKHYIVYIILYLRHIDWRRRWRLNRNNTRERRRRPADRSLLPTKKNNIIWLVYTYRVYNAPICSADGGGRLVHSCAGGYTITQTNVV